MCYFSHLNFVILFKIRALGSEDAKRDFKSCKSWFGEGLLFGLNDQISCERFSAVLAAKSPGVIPSAFLKTL